MMSSGLRRRRALFAVLGPVALVAALVACTDDGPVVDPVPDGAAVVAAAAQAMAGTASAHVVLVVDPPVGGLPVRRNEGDLTAEGDAQGSIAFQQGDQVVEVEYRQTASGSAFLRFPVSPDWVPAGPVVGVYDPAAMLDPARGVARLLSTATGGHTTGADQVDGVAAWRVEVVLDEHALDTFVPGVPAGLTGDLWIDQATARLLKAVVRVADPAASITITLSDFNVPVSVPAQ